MRIKKMKLFTLYSLLISFCVFAFSAEAFAGGVSLSATPTAQTVTVGQTAAYTIKINRDNYADKVTLSATGLPSGVTASFSPNVTTATSSTLKLQTLTSTPIGTFSINVKATANGVSIAPITIKLTTQPLPAISLTISPEAQSVIAGQTTYYDIRINRTGFSGPVDLSVENVPSGVSVVFEPQSTSGNTSRMWIYSNGLPSFAQSFGMNVVAKRLGFDIPREVRAVKLYVNCDIVWSEQGHQEFNGSSDFATTVTSDNSGNVYAAGHVVRNGATELWIAKYNSSSGVRLWLRNVTLTNVAGLGKTARAIAVDNTGSTIYLAGSTLTAGGVNTDAFIAKFDSNGNQLSNYVFGHPTYEDGVGGMALSFNSNARPVLTAVLNVNRTNVGSGLSYAFFNLNQMIVDSNGIVYPGFGNALRDQETGDPNDLFVASDGSIYVVGKDLYESQTDAYFVGFAMRLDPAGRVSYDLPLAEDIIPTRVAANSIGNAFIAGTQYRFHSAGNSSKDVWLSKLNTNGSIIWTNYEATVEDEEIGDMTTDSSGNLIYSGSTTGNLAAINPGPNSDAWLAKRSPDGTLFFVRQFAVADSDSFNAIALDASGNALLAGTTVNFKNMNFGFEDILLVKYSLSTGVTLFAPFITRLVSANVRSGAQIRIEGGNFFGVTGVYFDGQPLQFTIVSPSLITAVAPSVTTSKTANLTVSLNCLQINSPAQLTVTP